MQRADAMVAETFRRANAADKYRSIYYDGGHKFDLEMQKDAFDWLDRFLKTPTSHPQARINLGFSDTPVLEWKLVGQK